MKRGEREQNWGGGADFGNRVNKGETALVSVNVNQHPIIYRYAGVPHAAASNTTPSHLSCVSARPRSPLRRLTL